MISGVSSTVKECMMSPTVLALGLCFLAIILLLIHSSEQQKKMKLRSGDYKNIENIWITMKEEQFTQIIEINPQITIFANEQGEVMDVKISHPVNVVIKSKAGCGGELKK